MTRSMHLLRFRGQGDDGTIASTFMHRVRRTARRRRCGSRNLHLAHREQTRQPGVDAGEALLGVGIQPRRARTAATKRGRQGACRVSRSSTVIGGAA